MLTKHSKAIIGILVITFFSAQLLFVIAAEKAKEDVKEFIFQGSIEPKIVPEHMEKYKEYEIHVFIKPNRRMYKPHIEPLSMRTDHQFSFKFDLQRDDALKEKESWFVKLLPIKWRQTQENQSSNDIEQIEVLVIVRFDDGGGKVINRKWVFDDPDLSLHYELNVGVLEGSEYWLKGKVALPPSIKLLPTDEFELSMKEDYFSKPLSFGGALITTKKENLVIKIKGNVLSIAIKFDAKLVNNFLQRPPKTSFIKVYFKRHFLKKNNANEKPPLEKLDIEAMKKKKDEIITTIEEMNMKGESLEKTKKIHEMREHSEGDNKAESSGTACADQSTTTTTTKNDCIICLSSIELSDQPECSKCTRHFHKGCIDEWIINNPSCPLCRSSEAIYILLLQDPVFSSKKEHYSFEYKYMLSELKGGDNNENLKTVKELWGDVETEEQKKFLHKNGGYKPNILKPPPKEIESYRNAIYMLEFVTPWAQSRIKTVKVKKEKEQKSNSGNK